MSAVFGRPKGARSITTLKVPGSLLSDVMVCSSTVEKESERACGGAREAWGNLASESPFEASSTPRRAGSGGGGVGSERGVRDPYRLGSHSLLVGRRCASSVALSGGVWGEGKMKGSGCGRLRWFPGRTVGLCSHGVSGVVVSCGVRHTVCRRRRWYVFRRTSLASVAPSTEACSFH